MFVDGLKRMNCWEANYLQCKCIIFKSNSHSWICAASLKFFFLSVHCIAIRNDRNQVQMEIFYFLMHFIRHVREVHVCASKKIEKQQKNKRNFQWKSHLKHIHTYAANENRLTGSTSFYWTEWIAFNCVEHKTDGEPNWGEMVIWGATLEIVIERERKGEKDVWEEDRNGQISLNHDNDILFVVCIWLPQRYANKRICITYTYVCMNA